MIPPVARPSSSRADYRTFSTSVISRWDLVPRYTDAVLFTIIMNNLRWARRDLEEPNRPRHSDVLKIVYQLLSSWAHEAERQLKSR